MNQVGGKYRESSKHLQTGRLRVIPRITASKKI